MERDISYGAQGGAIQTDIGFFVQAFPVMQTPGIAIDLHRSGFMNYAFGCRAGPDFSVEYLVHEVAHAVELEEARWGAMTASGWGLRFPTVWIHDRYCDAPHSAQMTERECRVTGIQIRMLEMARFRVAQDFAKDCSRVFSDFHSDAYFLGGDKEDQTIRMTDLIAEAYEMFTPELVMRNLCRVVPYIASRRTEWERSSQID